MWKTVRKVQKFVEKYEMIQPGELLVAGISGGADSVCLLYLLKELQKVMEFRIVAVHVNHQLRGEEAERDEKFVKISVSGKISLFTVSTGMWPRWLPGRESPQRKQDEMPDMKHLRKCKEPVTEIKLCWPIIRTIWQRP